ncbi:hypothetical protein RCC94_03280 [Exiguobacterium acetylicum]|uniref:hypothetical protein n=1 Tax=Exiguobacterium acetylicum TaxID=41170 RepID=UPI0027DEC957|nr:hypothetical protein [Exiguobacterium acetylicum]MDQ6466492.1 hypothetical protein [Exiguobacterium acetylicum]
MIVTLSKQVDGSTYFWFMYRDGRTIQMYHGVTEQWKLDQDVSDSMEERYTFRHQAKRRLNELIAEKQAEGYRQDDIYGMQPGRKEREKFRRRTSWFAYLLIGLGLFQFVTPFTILPIVVLAIGIILMFLAFLSKNQLPMWIRIMCFVDYFLMHISFRQEQYIPHLFPILSIGTGMLLWFYLFKKQHIKLKASSE